MVKSRYQLMVRDLVLVIIVEVFGVADEPFLQSHFNQGHVLESFDVVVVVFEAEKTEIILVLEIRLFKVLQVEDFDVLVRIVFHFKVQLDT